jgi:hypothetical protein
MKVPVTRMKGQSTDWEKVFPNYIFDIKLVSRIYKELQTS